MKYKKKRLKDLKERRLKRKKNEQGRYISSDHLTMQQWYYNIFQIHNQNKEGLMNRSVNTSNEVIQYQQVLFNLLQICFALFLIYGPSIF